VADDGFTAFFQDAYPRVVGQLRLLTGDLASAEDAAQEAFVRAASRWRQLARYDQPEAWVRMTAFRLAIDLLRRARRSGGSWPCSAPAGSATPSCTPRTGR
jgi:RNA polymerase sigma-70 factor, ECF subfamily